MHLSISKLISSLSRTYNCVRIQQNSYPQTGLLRELSSIDLPNVKNDAQSDLLLEKLDEASSRPQQLFNLIDNNKSILTGLHCSRALKYVADNFKNEPAIKMSPHLTLICNTLTRKSRFLSTSEVLNVISILHNLEISPNTVIMQTFLQHIRARINFLTFGQIIYLERLLEKFFPTPLIKSLLVALPIVANNHVDMQMDSDNLRHLVQLFRYASLHRFTTDKLRKISEFIRDCPTDWNLNHATTILWAFTSLSSIEVLNHKVLMDKAIAALTKNINDISSDDFIKLMNSLHQRKLFPFSLFKLSIHKAFVENWDLKKFHFLVTVAKTYRYTNFKLFKVYSMIAKDSLLGRSLQVSIFEILNNLADINFVPADLNIFWDWIKYEANEGLNAKILMEMSLNLMSLRLDTNIFKDSIFNNEFFKYITNEQETDFKSIKDKLIILSLMNKDDLISTHLRKSWMERISMEERETDFDAKLSLQKSVNFAFKNDYYIYSSVLTTFGVYIDHLLIPKTDLPPFSESELVLLKNGQIKYSLKNFSSSKLKIAIILPTSADYAVDSLRLTKNPALASRVLKHNKFKVVQVVYSNWKHLLEKETVGYLKRAVNESLSEK